MIYKKKFILILLLCASFSGFAQELSDERKYYNLKKAEAQLFELPFTTEQFTNEIIPAVHQKRDSIAPNYPDRSQIVRDREVINQAFYQWISDYPAEYSTYINYLNLFYRERK